MRERIQEFFRSIKEWWGNTGKRMKIVILSALGGILVISLVVVLVLNHKEYAMLYSGMYSQESAKVLATLNEMGIEPQISNTGAIYVEEGQVASVRMRLAQDGFEGNTLGYEIYTGSSLTATQAEKNQMLVFQTQDRLQDTIKVYDEVDQVIVNISVPQQSIYALQDNTLPPTASVTVRNKPGHKLNADQVQAIMNIVRTSVSGMTEENITIADESGDLKLMLEGYSDNNASKLDLSSQVNRSVRERVLAILQPIYGTENVKVEAYSVLDTDSKITERTEYIPQDPDNPTNNPWDYVETDREKLGGLAGPVEGVVGANDNVDVPEYTARDVDVNDADSFVARDVYDYLVSSVKEQIVKEGYNITDMTVAVVINSANLPDSQRDQVIDLVSRTAGVPVENVSVQNIQFWESPGLDLEPAPVTDWTMVTIVIAVALLALSIIIVMIVLHYRKKREEEERLAAEAAALEEEEMSLVDLMNQEGEYEPIAIPEGPEVKLKNQIRDLANSDPEIVASLIKTWLLQAP